MTIQEINRELWRLFSNYDYKLFNVFVFGSESDFLAVSTSGYVWEVEVKRSRADFFNDFKKTTSTGMNKHEYLISEHTMKPNKFCFAVPEGLITVDEIPKHAGLIYLKKYNARIIKQPKFLHKDKLFEKKYFLKQMLNKFYYRHMDLKNVLEMRDWEIKYKQHRINFYAL